MKFIGNPMVKAAALGALTIALIAAPAASAWAAAPDGRGGGPYATAPHDRSAEVGGMAQQVRQALAHNPGSRQIDAHTIALGKGAFMDLADGKCSRGRLCVYKDSNFSGGAMYWSTCTTQDLRRFHWPNGESAVGSISSIDNRNQYGDVQSRFYDSRDRFMIAVNAGHYLKDLSKDSSQTGGSPNDKTYKIKVC
ncbi:peptidase inhibitor family I36 protein [Streptomyces sp. NPDC050617]|uniref:peptidase inhibitor family I36 protein n=1 Tax=Streptomyces sp. NPDC050617 TaxID=3154628 RepID=UPI00341D2536